VKRAALLQVLQATLVTAIILWSLGPIIVGLLTSFSTETDVRSVPPIWVPPNPSLTAYQELFQGTGAASTIGGTTTQEGAFGRSVWNSVTLTTVSTIGILLVAICAAYAFTRLRFNGNKVFYWALLATMIIPVFTIVVTLFQLMASAHLIDTTVGISLVLIATQTPLATWQFHNQLRDLSPEPEQAALIDGCTRWQAFVRVVIPQMSSGIAAVSAILMLAVWGEFLIPLLLTSTLRSKPVTVLITEFIGKYTTNYPLLAAAGIIALLPPAIVVLVLNRRIRGMLSGAS